MHGHRKISAFMATTAIGQAGGVRLAQWFWDVFLASATIPPLPDDIAYSLLGLIAGGVAWFVKEQNVSPAAQPELQLVPAYPPAARRAGGIERRVEPEPATPEKEVVHVEN